MSTAGAGGGDRLTGNPLLAAKLVAPRIRTPLVDRPRLVELVSHGVEGLLTVVSGAAGSGKTLLLAAWCATGSAPGPVAWLTLDRDDDEPGVFWAYVIAALRRAGVRLPDEVGEPFLGSSVAHPLLARVADGLASRATPLVLVLDQFEAVTSREIHRELDFVLRNADGNLRLVLLTRDDGSLRLHRYALRGELARIRNDDLAFTGDEAADLLRQHGVRLPPETLAALIEQTRGWAAGLRLSAVALQQRADPAAFVSALPAADPTLTGYLVDEVLDVQPAGIRDFLLRTSVVDRLCPALADALTGRQDGDVVLAGLAAGNVLTTTVEQAPGWYRYHPQFAHVLRGELRRDHPGAVDELHRRASAWFDSAGLLVDAVRHAAAAGDWQLAAATVVRRLAVGTLLAGWEATQLEAALTGLPEDLPGAMPAAVRSARALARFDLDTCRQQVALAEQTAGEEPDDARPALLASVAVIRAILARVAGDLPAAEAALAIGETALSGVRDAAQHPELRALLLSSVGTVELWTGRIDAAERTLRRGLAVSRSPGCEYPRLNILGRLAMVEFFRGRLGRAQELGLQELAFAEDSGLPVTHRTGAGHLALVLVAVERGDQAAARSHLGQAEKTVGARHDPFVATFVPLLRAVEHADGRDFRRALAALSRVPAVVGGRPLPTWLADRVALTAAGIHLERREADPAAASLDQVRGRDAAWALGRAALELGAGDRRQAAALLAPVLAGEGGADEATLIAAWLLTARLELGEGRAGRARAAVGRALVLARPELRRRLFLRPGPAGRNLLGRFPDLLSAHPWLDHPLADRASVAREGGPPGNQPSGSQAPAVLERLTAREATVLARMAQAMSVEDIAHDLFVSVNTVKTHQRSIYRKLGVSRRNDAVRTARSLGLIPE